MFLRKIAARPTVRRVSKAYRTGGSIHCPATFAPRNVALIRNVGQPRVRYCVTDVHCNGRILKRLHVEAHEFDGNPDDGCTAAEPLSSSQVSWIWRTVSRVSRGNDSEFGEKRKLRR